jgi:hypothetical protein
MKPIKTAEQLIAEIVEERAERLRIEAEKERKSAKILATVYTELKRTVVAVAFNGPDISLVGGEGPDIIVERYGRLLCRISGRDGGVRVGRLPVQKAWDFTEDATQDALKRVLEILTDDCEERPHDTRDRFADYVPFEPISRRI